MLKNLRVFFTKFTVCMLSLVLINVAFSGALNAQDGYTVVTLKNGTVQVFDYGDLSFNWATLEIQDETTCQVTEFSMSELKEVYVGGMADNECYGVTRQDRLFEVDFLDGSYVYGYFDLMVDYVDNAAQTVTIDYDDIYKITFYNSSCGTSWQKTAHSVTQWAVDYSPELDMYVSVGNGGSIYTSSDGASWTLRTSGVTQTLKAVYWNPLGTQKFVAAGYLGKILTSTNGINWTPRASGVTANLKGIAYGNGKYVVVGYSGVILTSTDAVTWTQRTSGTTNRLYDVCYAGGLFVAVGTGGTIVTSTDGITWTSRVSGTTNILHDVTARTHAPALFVAVGDNGKILTSSNGINWTSRNSTTTKEIFAVTFGPDESTFVATAYYGTGEVLTSHDGINWSKTVMSGRNYYGVTYGGYDSFRYVAVGKDYIARTVCGYWWPY